MRADDFCADCGCIGHHHPLGCRAESHADRAARVSARREAARSLRLQRVEDRAQELGFERKRLAFTGLDGVPTWASVCSSSIAFRGSWGPFLVAFLITDAGRYLVSLSRISSADRWTTEVDRDTFHISLAAQSVMGTRPHGQLSILPALSADEEG